MQIGLVRHFKIPYRKWQWLTSTGYADFLRWYDGSEGRERSGQAPATAWQRCYSSDMLRAVETAGKLTRGPVTCMPLLREIPQAPVFDTRLKLPLIVWHVLSRIGWWFDHPSQPEGRTASTRRAARIVEFMLRQPVDQPLLIVTHGFLMYGLRRELARRGVRGRIPTHPQCGDVYVLTGPAGAPATGVRPAPAAGQPAAASPSPEFRWHTRA